MRRCLIGCAVAFSLIVAACGGDGDEDDGADAGVAEVGASTTGDAGAVDSDTSTSPGRSGDVDPDGVLRIAYDLTAASRGGFGWDPTKVQSTSDTGLYHWVYGGLMRPSPDGTPVPDLAKGIEVVDPNTIEVVLRDGLTLSDGTPFDAQLVKQAIEHNLAQEESVAFGTDFFELSTVEVLSPTVVRLTIPDGSAAGWADRFLMGIETVPVPPGTDFKEPVGAGPYTVAEFVPDERLVLEKNPAYWDAESIRVQRIEIVNASTTEAQVAALNADQVDWTALNAFTMDAVGDEFELLTPVDPNSLHSIVICKDGSGPLADPQVRRALSMAIDRQALSDAFFGGEALPAWDLWPEGHRFHNPDLTEAHAYDPERARELLDQAGHGDGFTFEAVPIPSGGSPQIAQVVQQQFADIGVTMTLSQSANFVEDLYIRKTTPVGIVPSVGVGGLGKVRMWVGESIGNICQYSDPDLDRLATELGSVAVESDRAVELWHEFQAVAVEDTLSILLLFGPQVSAFDGNTLGGDVVTAYYPAPLPEIRDLYVTRQ